MVVTCRLGTTRKDSLDLHGPFTLAGNSSAWYWFYWNDPNERRPMVIAPQPSSIHGSLVVSETRVLHQPPWGSAWQSYFQFEARVENRQSTAQSFYLAVAGTV
ncbi:MAG TPA: hypothetical protein VF520_12920 [Thermoleophilaceae bacterium]